MIDTILCGDSIENMRKLEDESVDLIFADPPYWMRTSGTLERVEGTEFNGCDDEWDKFTSLEEYENFTKEWLSECRRILKKDGSIWVIGGMQCIYTIGSIMTQLGFWIINDVVWHKTNPTPNFKGTRLCNSHETLIWATKEEKSRYTFNYKTAKEINHENVSDNDFKNGIRKQLGSIWRIPICSGAERIKDADGNKLHSTQKPEELLYRIIVISSNQNDIVFDPFGGTMTTGAVAKKLGRHYIMSEKNPIYCEYGRNRINNIVPVIDDIAKATYDIKPLRVKIPEMIVDGFLYENEPMFMDGVVGSVNLLANGKVLMQDGTVTDMHSAAAKMRNVKAKRVNGFDFWKVIRNDELVGIKEIREKYREYRKKLF